MPLLTRILHQLTYYGGRYRRCSGSRAGSPYNQYALTVACPLRLGPDRLVTAPDAICGLKRLTKACITLLLLSGMVSGCGWLWPRENVRDPARCDPTCPTGLVCVDGICKLGDGGLPYDLGKDSAPVRDLPPPDRAPE